MKGNIFINGIASGLSEIIAYAIGGGYVFKQYGIKWAFCVSFMISLIGMGSLLIYQGKNQYLFGLFIFIGKFGFSSAFNICYLGNAVLFPGSILATSYGICNFLAKVFTIGAPFIAE